MFIYFPEFFYKQTKLYLRNTFAKPLDKQSMSTSIESIINKVFEDSTSSNPNQNILNGNSLKMISDDKKIIQKDEFKLPLVSLEHCNKFYDYLSEINPISNYDFNENKITVCVNKMKNKIDFSRVNDLNQDRIIIFESLLLKELSYFFDYNYNFANKRLNLNDKAKMVIRGCLFEQQYQINTKNSQYLSNNKFRDELVKRCAYLDFKYKFFKELEYESSKTDENINCITKKYIDSNFY